MIITTTNTLQDKQVTAYHGIVTGTCIMGANVFRDLFAGIRDIVGGRSSGRRANATICWRSVPLRSRSRPLRTRSMR